MFLKGDEMESLKLQLLKLIISKLTDSCYKISNNNDNKTDNRDKDIKLPNISLIEIIFKDTNELFQSLSSEAIGELLTSLETRQLITSYIQRFDSNGVKLKLKKRSIIYIQLEYHKVKINRYTLIPASGDDKARLMELDGGSTTVIPLDRELGFRDLPFRMSVKAMLRVCRVAQGCRSFQLASSNLKSQASPIDLSPTSILGVVNHIGGIVFRHDCERAERESKKIDDRGEGGWYLPDKDRTNDILYIMPDGAMINTRKKNPKDSSWREVKLGIVYRASDVTEFKRTGADGKIETQHRINVKDYSPVLGSVDEFRKHLFASAIRMGYGKITRTVIISDGATWIRNMALTVYPDAQQILDLFHLKEKVFKFGKLYFNDDEDKYRPWCQRINERLEESSYMDVLGEIKDKERELGLETSLLSTYINNNKKNIDYKRYRAEGLIVGSGSIESSNKIVTQYRLKQGGMRWNTWSAQTMLTLRAREESDRWETDVVMPIFEKYGVGSLV
jgi:hypothetical protein